MLLAFPSIVVIVVIAPAGVRVSGRQPAGDLLAAIVVRHDGRIRFRLRCSGGRSPNPQ